METTVQQAQNLQGGAGPSKFPPSEEIHDSNDDGTIVEISSGPISGLDDIDLDDVQHPPISDEFLMVFEDEESNGSQHSTSKPKEKKKKTLDVSRMEFLCLQSKATKSSPQSPLINHRILMWLHRTHLLKG